MDISFKEQLNGFYKILDERADQIKIILIDAGFNVEKRYFNGHFDKDASGNYVKDYYPIPVIEVKGLCDIEIVEMHINVSAKISKENAINFDYGKFADCYFEVYGVNDYLADYCKSGEDITNLLKNLEACNEREIGFAFTLEKDCAVDRILKLLTLLKNNGFYY